METNGKSTNADADAVFELAAGLQGATDTFFEHPEQPGAETPVPYGDPESLIEMPDGSTRKWKTLTAAEHQILGRIRELQADYQERSAEYHEQMADLIIEFQQTTPS